MIRASSSPGRATASRSWAASRRPRSCPSSPRRSSSARASRSTRPACRRWSRPSSSVWKKNPPRSMPRRGCGTTASSIRATPEEQFYDWFEQIWDTNITYCTASSFLDKQIARKNALLRFVGSVKYDNFGAPRRLENLQSEFPRAALLAFDNVSVNFIDSMIRPPHRWYDSEPISFSNLTVALKYDLRLDVVLNDATLIDVCHDVCHTDIVHCLECLTLDRCTNYNDWFEIGRLIYNSGGSVEIFDQWSQKCRQKYNVDCCAQMWQYYSRNAPNPIYFNELVEKARHDNILLFNQYELNSTIGMKCVNNLRLRDSNLKLNLKSDSDFKFVKNVTIIL